ncbi:MAG: family 43 glycosylhydrolase [Syntrophomonadaceae bacterium]
MKIKLLPIFLLLFSGLSAASCGDTAAIMPDSTEYFTNPVVEAGADPWVIQHEGYYYYCFSDNGKIYVSKSQKLQDIGKVTPLAVWTPEAGKEYSKELWAPELHFLDGKWYIYVAADDGDNYHHHIYVLEGTSPQSAFILKGRLKAAATDKWAIDGTVLEMEGSLYFIWSGWEGDENLAQNLYIAPMSSPWIISGERVLISKPELPWELHGTPLINEGPEVLKHKGRIFIIYSASGSWTDDYCLGELDYDGGGIMEKESWHKKTSPVFTGTENVFGPGHASFTKSPDGKEDWIVYHAAKKKGSGWDRNVRIQKFSWNEDGTPNFGSPIAEGVKIPVPSGK